MSTGIIIAVVVFLVLVGGLVAWLFIWGPMAEEEIIIEEEPIYTPIYDDDIDVPSEGVIEPPEGTGVTEAEEIVDDAPSDDQPEPVDWENLNTPWNDEGNKIPIYLDRHDISCKDANKESALRHFRYNRQRDSMGNPTGKMRYSYSCQVTPSGLSSCRTRYTPWNDENDSTYFLDRHGPACRPNEVMRSFKLQRQRDADNKPTGKMRYSYACCTLDDAKGDCKENWTGWNDAGNPARIPYLERHPVSCNPGEYISSFKFMRHPDNNKIAYKYKCCT